MRRHFIEPVLTHLPLPALLAIFVASGFVIWFAGIALQTVVIIVLDVFGKRKRGAPHPAHHRPRGFADPRHRSDHRGRDPGGRRRGHQLPKQADLLRVTPQALPIVVVWIVGPLLVCRANKHLPCHENGQRPDTAQRPPQPPLDNLDHTTRTAGPIAAIFARDALTRPQ